MKTKLGNRSARIITPNFFIFLMMAALATLALIIHARGNWKDHQVETDKKAKALSEGITAPWRAVSNARVQVNRSKLEQEKFERELNRAEQGLR